MHRDDSSFAKLMVLLAGFGLLLLALFMTGCGTLKAFKTGLGYNHKTGEISAELKGATEGGKYTENKGLNLGLELGNNTVPALIVAGGLGVMALMSYPVQRSLRLRKEKQWLERLNQLRAAGVVSLPSGSPLVSPLASPPPTSSQPSKTGSEG